MNIKRTIKKILINPEKEKEKAQFIYERNVKESLRILEATIDALDSYGIKYYLDFGTLIGAMRDQAFIPWDDDIDISLLNPQDKKLLPKAIALIKEKSKLKVTRATFARSIYNRIQRAKREEEVEVFVKKVSFSSQSALRVVKVRNYKFNLFGYRKGAGRNCLDIFIKYPKNDKKTYWMAQNREHSVDSALIGKKLIEIDFYHLKCKIPANYDEYLTAMYGEWKVAKKDWQYYEHDTCSTIDRKEIQIDKIVDSFKREAIIPANTLNTRIILNPNTINTIPYTEGDENRKMVTNISSVENKNVEININNSIETIISENVNKLSLLSGSVETLNQRYTYILKLVSPINKACIITLNLTEDDLDKELNDIFLEKTIIINKNNQSTIFTLTKEEKSFVSKFKKFKLTIIDTNLNSQVLIDRLNSSVIKTFIPVVNIALVKNILNQKIQSYSLFLNRTVKKDKTLTLKINNTLIKKIVIPTGNLSTTFILNECDIEQLEINNKKYTILNELPNNFFLEEKTKPSPLELSLIHKIDPVESSQYNYSLQLNKASQDKTIISIEIEQLKNANMPNSILITKTIEMPAGKKEIPFTIDYLEDEIHAQCQEIKISIIAVSNKSEKIIHIPPSLITSLHTKAILSISQYKSICQINQNHTFLLSLDKPSREDTKVIIEIKKS